MDTYGHPGEPPPAAARPRLANLRVICAALAVSSALMGFLSWLLVEQMGLRETVPDLPGLPLSLTVAATVLILLASRIRSGLLRRIPRPAQPDPEAVLAAYQRATIASFALFEGAAVLGLLLALITGEVRYGLIFSLAAVLSMLVRWPRQGEVNRLLRRLGV
jgi:hypothetical protein